MDRKMGEAGWGGTAFNALALDPDLDRLYVSVGYGSFPDLRYSASAIHSFRNQALLESAYLAKSMLTFSGLLTEADVQAFRACIVREGRATESG